MGLAVVFVCALFYSGTESAPADPPTYGTLAANDFSNNLAKIEQNMYTGVTSLSDPLFKLAIDTAPNLAQLYAILNGVNVPPALAALGKNLYGNLAVGGGKLGGDAAVLGSSVLQSSMNVGAHRLQAGNDVLEATGKSGIALAGKLGDYTASGATVGSDILASGLKTAGDSMQVGSLGVNVVAQGISGLTDAIAARMVAAVASAESVAAQLLDSGVKVLENGALQFSNKTQERVYNALAAYIQILVHVQNLINHLDAVITGVTSAASVVSTSGAGLGVGNSTLASASVAT